MTTTVDVAVLRGSPRARLPCMPIIFALAPEGPQHCALKGSQPFPVHFLLLSASAQFAALSGLTGLLGPLKRSSARWRPRHSSTYRSMPRGIGSPLFPILQQPLPGGLSQLRRIGQLAQGWPHSG